MSWISTRELISRGIPQSALERAEKDGKLAMATDQDGATPLVLLREGTGTGLTS